MKINYISICWTTLITTVDSLSSILCTLSLSYRRRLSPANNFVFNRRKFSMAGGEESYSSSYIANCVLNAFLSYTTIMLNSVTVHAIRKTCSLSNTLKTLLLSLAVADLGIGLLAQPFYIVWLVMKIKQDTESSFAYDAAYRTFLVSTNLFCFASFFGVTALSVDRFLAIHLHLRYKELVTHKRVVALVISIWAYSVFLFFVRLWIPREVIYVIFAINNVACYLTTTCFNYKVFKAVRQHQQHIQALQVQQLAQNVEMANVGRLRKSAVTAIYVYLVFVFCCLPNTCVVWTIAITSSSEPLYAIIKLYALTLVFLNSSLNPLIYSWKMRDIRHNIINIVRNVFSSQN